MITCLHEKYVGYVQFPHIMFATKLHTLSEYRLHLCIVLFVPVYLCLCHQHWDIAGIGYTWTELNLQCHCIKVRTVGPHQ